MGAVEHELAGTPRLVREAGVAAARKGRARTVHAARRDNIVKMIIRYQWRSGFKGCLRMLVRTVAVAVAED